MNSTLEINSLSKVPKYKQVVDNILADIHLGKFKKGQKLPSINETSFEYLLSRDTVEKAYNELRNKGIIVSVRGKGYYVNDTQSIGKKKVLLMLNKVNNYKKLIYTSFFNKLQDKATVDLKIHNGDIHLLKEFIQDDLRAYHYIMVLSQFNAADQEVSTVLKSIPKEKLILLEYKPSNFNNFNSSLCHDIEKDVYEALKQGMVHFDKYEELEMIFPLTADSCYARQMKDSFRNFCFHHKYAFSISNGLMENRIKKGKILLLTEEEDLIEAIKICNNKHLKIGEDIGIISFNDNPIKEVLCNGIDVITPDYDQLTDQMANIVLNNERLLKNNNFYYIKRSSV